MVLTKNQYGKCEKTCTKGLPAGFKFWRVFILFPILFDLMECKESRPSITRYRSPLLVCAPAALSCQFSDFSALGAILLPFSTLCLRSILSTWTFWRTMTPIRPKFLVYALLLPSYNSPVLGSPLGISISLCDPGPCAATAICKVGSSCHVVNAKPCSRNKKDYDETTTPCYHV